MIYMKKIILNGGANMKNKKHSKNNLGKNFTSRVGTGKNKLHRKTKEVSECYKMKLEHSEELNPDDFE